MSHTAQVYSYMCDWLAFVPDQRLLKVTDIFLSMTTELPVTNRRKLRKSWWFKFPMKVLRYPSTLAWLEVISFDSLIMLITDPGVALRALYKLTMQAMSHNSAHAVEHDGVTGADLEVGDTGHTPSKPSTCSYLHVLVTYLLVSLSSIVRCRSSDHLLSAQKLPDLDISASEHASCN